MQVSASLEKALSHLTEWRRTAARVRARDLTNVLGRVAAVLFCLELVYLALGNALLRSNILKDAVGSSGQFHLSYSSAYTLLPGRVHVENLKLRFEDYNVQFLIGLEQADVDLSLSELAFKKFHVFGLQARGTQFRMRHKLIAVGNDAQRVRAYPPIAGFADPPYYVGVRSPPIPDDEYDLWEVRVENVRALVSELWVLEHRFRGRAQAKGSFVVRPARWVQVEPASLAFESGTLTLGDELVARNLRGRIDYSMPDMDVQTTDGLGVLREMSTTVKLTLDGGQLDFLDAYLTRFGALRYAGQADWRLDLSLQRGIVQHGSRVGIQAKPLQVLRGDRSISGDLTATLGREGKDALFLDVEAPLLVGRRAQQSVAGPQLRGLRGQLRVLAVDLVEEMSLDSGRLSLEQLSVPALAWFDTEKLRLGGSAEAELVLVRDAERRLSGTAQLKALEAQVISGDFVANAHLKLNTAFSRSAAPSAPLHMDKLSAHLSAARVRSGARRTDPFSMSLNGAGLNVTLGDAPEAHGLLRVHVSSAEALLPLLVGDSVQNLTSTALGLRALEGRATIAVTERGLDVKVVDARSGNLTLRGYFAQSSEAPRAAFLLSSGPINVGVTVSEGESEVSPFVGDDWLVTAWPRVRKLVGDRG